MKKDKNLEFINDLHPVLQRQVKKFILPFCQHEDISILTQFLAAVGETYESNEKEKKITDRMFDLSAKEYETINNRLMKEKTLIEKSVKQLLKAVEQFDESNAVNANPSELYEIAEFIKERAIHQKSIEKELISARESAEHANNAKSDFLSTMSHEIRTPLNVIVGLIHVMLEDEHLDTQNENLEILKINAENLKYLINDILDFSKIESGKLELDNQSFNLKDLLRRIKTAHISNAKENGLDFKLLLDDELPDLVVGDSNRLGQCLTNLVSNAIKFTKEGSVRLKATMVGKQGDLAKIRFTVIDTGIGIPEKDQTAIFEPFKQVTSASRISKGTGLGLSILNRLVRLMGSEIKLISFPDKGSEFYFDVDFPISTDVGIEQKPSDKNEEVKNLNDDVHILLVEDFIFNVTVVQKILKKYGVQITVAQNGQEAVDLVLANPSAYDIVLMDLRMPVLDGISATKLIRDTGNQIPIIALTASTTKETLDTVRDIGMNGFIAKPIDPSTFAPRISDYLFESKSKTS